jgi:hypothetical protein
MASEEDADALASCCARHGAIPSAFDLAFRLVMSISWSVQET